MPSKALANITTGDVSPPTHAGCQAGCLRLNPFVVDLCPIRLVVRARLLLETGDEFVVDPGNTAVLVVPRVRHIPLCCSLALTSALPLRLHGLLPTHGDRGYGVKVTGFGCGVRGAQEQKFGEDAERLEDPRV